MTPANDEPLDAEDNSEPPYASVQPGGSYLDQSDVSQTHSTTTCEGLRLKTGQVVKYTDNESGQTLTGKILNRAEKATGKHKNWYNLPYSEPEETAGTTGSVGLGQMDNLQVIPSERAKLCTDYHEDDTLIMNDDAFIPAKHTELSTWKRNDVFELVKNKGQKSISTWWVCTLKETPVAERL